MADISIKLDDSTPTQELLNNANKTVTITDSKGHAIGLKDPGVLAQFRLVEILGAETAKNETFMHMVLPLIYIYEIDGEPLAPLGSRLALDALIQRLGHPGVNATIEGVVKNFGANDAEAEKAAIKK